VTGGRQRKSNSLIYIGVGVGLLLSAVVGVVLFLMNSDSEAGLTFDWPVSDRAGATLTVDDRPVAIPASGPWEYRCPPGDRHIVAVRPAFKSDTTVSLTAGQQQTIAHAMETESGAGLEVARGRTLWRGRSSWIIHAQSLSPGDPLELPVEPGRHVVHITRPGAEPFETIVSVASDQRQSIAVVAREVRRWSLTGRWQIARTLD